MRIDFSRGARSALTKIEIAVELRPAGFHLHVDAEGRRMRDARVQVFPRIDERRRPVGERRLHPRVQRVDRLEIEVAGDDRRRRPQIRVERSARRVGDRPPLRVRAALGVDRAQRLDLRGALHLRIPLEVRRDHAHLAERRDDRGLDRDARHAVDAGLDRERQQVAEHLPHRQPRCDQVAEVPAPTVFRRMVDGDAGIVT